MRSTRPSYDVCDAFREVRAETFGDHVTGPHCGRCTTAQITTGRVGGLARQAPTIVAGGEILLCSPGNILA